MSLSYSPRTCECCLISDMELCRCDEVKDPVMGTLVDCLSEPDDMTGVLIRRRQKVKRYTVEDVRTEARVWSDTWKGPRGKECKWIEKARKTLLPEAFTRNATKTLN